MPILVYMRHSQANIQYIIVGEKLNLKDWKGKGLIEAQAQNNGHALLLRKEDVILVEHMPMAEWAHQQAEAKARAGTLEKPKIVMPKLIMPKPN